MIDVSEAIHTENWPRCAKCDIPVLEFYGDYDPFADCVVLVARCHGSIETVYLPSAMWMQMVESMEEFEFTPAFAGNQPTGPDVGH